MSTPPGAPLPSPHPAPRPAPGSAPGAAPESGADLGGGGDLAARLSGLPVAAHADVLTAEHDRLHRLLATIDRS